MTQVEFLPGITQRRVVTGRLEIASLETGPSGGVPIVLVHGNISSSWFFQELMLALANEGGFKVYAPDMRGYGDTQTQPVDATRGVRDFSDDLASFVQELGLTSFHLLGWSLGGNIVLQYTQDYPETVRSLALQAPGSPYGFGGTHGPDGQLNYPDGAGCGGGGVNPDFRQRIKEGDRSADAPTSPRNIMNSFYFKPPFKVSPELEEVYVSAMLSTKEGDQNWPGDLAPSENWPNVAPGPNGVNNTLAPTYLNQSGIVDISPKPDILWYRGDSDQIVSDNSLFDFGVLGQLGAVPGWPGEEVFPAQPMIGQMRALLEKYQANGGQYHEEVLADCGHTPHLEKAGEVTRLLLDFFKAH
ncbi:MAG: alpha/beta hydrolase [Chloroflexi bacterium]|jgi:pimeloyl-ACP methyl ester carboxylesterase|nr:alpha/beta hydrolase [Chloroflexota bacterium]